MIKETEIVSSLAPINEKLLNIPDLYEYAKKLIKLGKQICFRQGHDNKLISYLLYYDKNQEIFVSMVWTHPNYRGHGLARQLIGKIIHSSNKNIILKVHKNNPAKNVFKRMKFFEIEERDDFLLMGFRRQLAIMQPYLYPYVGYFHLIEASSLFVFYDDVNYIKKGWINRNRILLNNEDHLFAVPVFRASQNQLINKTLLSIDQKWKDKYYKKLSYAYKKAPHYSVVIDKIISVFDYEYSSVADLAINSIIVVYDYLGLNFNYKRSSICAPETRDMIKADRLIAITKKLGFKHYVNVSGGKELYEKDYFKSKDINLSFVKSKSIQYKQYKSDFVPWLSIIDLMMFNDKCAILRLFSEYTIE